MKKLALLTFALITIVACKNNTKTDNQTVIEKEKPVIKTSPKPALETGCYNFKSDSNNIQMEITELNEKSDDNPKY